MVADVTIAERAADEARAGNSLYHDTRAQVRLIGALR
jgi:hypothetical protein